ncbi:methionyl-tRNA formyltransferase, mitochondrial-like [Amphibalanus amphitrite]|uniref:methionyl-tRNA formyltransferase, mitochondrial-like n=1 Tax=Amphibalanus amphitrite TaxID=1232801 RepID=UPI001C929F40|nr:methionyl-tRNA formyltransferase, mitochondrial-like [Amphibalanus amphitrite]
MAATCTRSAFSFACKITINNLKCRYLLGCQLNHTSKLSISQGPIKVLYFGSDDFAIPTLKMLHSKRDAGQLSELAVVCVRLKAGKTAARRYAERHGLPVLDWPPTGLTAGRYHLGVVASFGHLLPSRLIDLFPVGVLNVHASLLPRWRGAAPVVHALLAGDSETGVTIMTVKPHKFDIGDIVAQAAVPISPTVHVQQLTAELAQLGSELLERCMEDIPAALAAARPQTEEGVTLAPRLTPADYRVDWDRPAAAVLRQSRALPGPLLTALSGRRVRLLALSEPEAPAGPPSGAAAAPGRLTRRRRALLVRCADGWLALDRLQLQGKPVMSGEQFWNGYLSGAADDQRCFDR